MLRPIAQVPSWPGLRAGSDLQVQLALWLSDGATTPEAVTEIAVRALHTSEHVKNWLWRFLQSTAANSLLLDAAKTVASISAANKERLRNWIRLAHEVSAQFQPNPSVWSDAPAELPEEQLAAFKKLMLAFYERLKPPGLPFDANGDPVEAGGVTYQQFVAEFKQVHGDSVCVLCGGPFYGPQVDHWVSKAKFPVLSIAPHNLLPICCICNEAPAKGTKATYTEGAAEAFKDWFHPYHRSGVGRVSMVYDVTKLGVSSQSLSPEDATRVQHLDGLLQLSSRWTATFKAEYRNRQKSLQQLVSNGYLVATADGVRAKLVEFRTALVADEPHFHVRELLFDHTLQPDILGSWVTELLEGEAVA